MLAAGKRTYFLTGKLPKMSPFTGRLLGHLFGKRTYVNVGNLRLSHTVETLGGRLFSTASLYSYYLHPHVTFLRLLLDALIEPTINNPHTGEIVLSAIHE